jgi:hypothetical protein
MSLKSYFRKDDGRLNPLGFIGVGVILLGLIPIAFVIAFEIFWVYQFRVNGPKASEAQTELETEFRSIKTLPGSTALFYHATNSPGQALVSDTYRTNLTFADVRRFYDAELTRHGWSFYLEEPMTEWGKDLGGKSARYCKGSYRADLQWAGERANHRWDYAFSMSYGLDAMFERYPEAFHKAGCK